MSKSIDYAALSGFEYFVYAGCTATTIAPTEVPATTEVPTTITTTDLPCSLSQVKRFNVYDGNTAAGVWTASSKVSSLDLWQFNPIPFQLINSVIYTSVSDLWKQERPQ